MKHLPNFITCLNVFAGCIAISFAMHGDTTSAAWCILAGAVCDFLDGFVARLLKAYSEIGKQLDSLADMVTFGAAPGAIVYHIIKLQTGNELLPYLGFIITVFSALRLAKFNIDTRQTENFIGMPTPAMAIFVVGFAFQKEISWELWATLATIPVLCLLMVCELPLFSLKFKNLNYAENKYRFLLLIGVPFCFWFHTFAPPIIIVWYILLSLIKHFIEPNTNELRS